MIDTFILCLVRYAVIASVLCAQVVLAGEFTIVKALKFSPEAPKLTLDLYLPSAQEKPVPCVIVIQGGGFSSQNGQRFKGFAARLAKAELAVALISYRGRPHHRHRDTLEDLRSSVRYVRSVAGERGIDPARIGATGRSAGGSLAALLAVNGGSTEQGGGIQAAVCFAGVFDFVGRFTDEEQLALQPRRETKMQSNGEWIGPPFSPTNKEWLEASAITHVDSKDPPILFLHSKDDTTVPWQQSKDMHRAMKDAGVASEIRLYETGGHGVDPKGAKPMVEMIAFFQKRL